MTYADIVRKHSDRQVEVYLPNQYYEGIIRSVGTYSFVLEVQNGSYVDPVEEITIFFINVDGIRVLSETSE